MKQKISVEQNCRFLNTYPVRLYVYVVILDIDKLKVLTLLMGIITLQI